MAYTTIDDPSAHHQTKIYTGNGNDGQAYTFDGNSDMQPDWLWVKNRSNTGPYSGHIFDSSRGANKSFFPDADNAEATNSSYGYLGAFQSDGFTVTSGSSGDERVNNNNDLYVMWGWKANGGTATATGSESGNNPAYSVQANTTAGFSIVTYTGTGAAGTVPHGLGAVPNVLLVKVRSAQDPWSVYHSANTSAPETDYLVLDSSAATADHSNRWNDTAPTSSVFTVEASGTVNLDAGTFVAYCFTEIQGYSKFGSYEGNGNTNGTFVYTGFSPAWVMVKRTDSGNNWHIHDNKRVTHNSNNKTLYANLSNVEATEDFDMLSNGFKLRESGGGYNASGGDYIYMAFAHHPFVSSKGVPTTAR